MYLVDRNKRKKGRKPNLYWRYSVPGRSKPVEEKCVAGVKARAAQAVELKRQIKAGTWIHPQERKAAKTTFRAFAMQVVEERAKAGIGAHETTPNQTERGFVVHHLIPAFGKYTFPELTFKVILDGFKGRPDDDDEVRKTRINHKGLSGRTVNSIHSLLRSILVRAAEEELIDFVPGSLSIRSDHLPPLRDVDPQWRANAKYRAQEIQAIVGCEAGHQVDRVLLATMFGTGPRYCELNKQLVRHYDRDLQPLRSLTVVASKMGRHAEPGLVRHVPVHPKVQAWLDWWLDEEWEFIYGRKPGPDDFLFPTPTTNGRARGKSFITHGAMKKRFLYGILPAAGLGHTVPEPKSGRRARGLHCTRHTFISLMRSARVDDKLLRAMTHSGTGDSVLDAYTHWEWEQMCEAVNRISLPLPPPPYRHRAIQLVTPVTSGPGFDADPKTPAFTGSKIRRIH